MSIPALKPIAQSVLQRPEYSATRGLTVEQWTEENHDRLKYWWKACRQYLDDSDDLDWLEFCATQFDFKAAQEPPCSVA